MFEGPIFDVRYSPFPRRWKPSRFRFQPEIETGFENSHTQYMNIYKIMIGDCHKISQFQICEFGHMPWILVCFLSDFVTFWSQMSQKSTIQMWLLQTCLCFCFPRKWFGMNDFRQNMLESKLCFCFLLEIRIGTALMWFKMVIEMINKILNGIEKLLS